jgi:hypothetical protein
MRKLTTLTLVGAIALASCTTEVVREVPATDGPPATQNRPPATPAPNPTEDFLAYVNGVAGSAIYWADEDLLEIGLLTCEALDSGASIREVVDTMEDSASTDGDIEVFATVLFAAVTFFCPEYEDALQRYISSI